MQQSLQRQPQVERRGEVVHEQDHHVMLILGSLPSFSGELRGSQHYLRYVGKLQKCFKEPRCFIFLGLLLTEKNANYNVYR